jgi:hypothetical protein
MHKIKLMVIHPMALQPISGLGLLIEASLEVS